MLSFCRSAACRVRDLVAGVDEVHARHHLNLALVDLRRDVQGLEPSRLARVAARRSRFDVHVDRSDGRDASRCGHLVGGKHVTNLRQVGVREDQANVANKNLEEGLDGVALILLQEVLDDLDGSWSVEKKRGFACEWATFLI